MKAIFEYNYFVLELMERLSGHEKRGVNQDAILIDQESKPNCDRGKAAFFALWCKVNGLGKNCMALSSPGHKDEVAYSGLVNSVFDHGINLLRMQMPTSAKPGQEKMNLLSDELQIQTLKRELIEVRSTGKIKEISSKERAIADRIQSAVSKYRYESGAFMPARIIDMGAYNCLGSSLLGGALYSEVGIRFLTADIPRHSTLFMVTADGQIEVREMQCADIKEVLYDHKIKGTNKDGSPLRVSDIADFSRKPQPHGLELKINDAYFNLKDKFKNTQSQSILLFDSLYGLKVQLLGNIGFESNVAHRYEEAETAFTLALEFNPNIARLYTGLGNTYCSMGDEAKYCEAVRRHYKRKAVINFKKSLMIDPQMIFSYVVLGNVLTDLGQTDEALSYFKKFKSMGDSITNMRLSFLSDMADRKIADLSNIRGKGNLSN